MNLKREGENVREDCDGSIRQNFSDVFGLRGQKSKGSKK